MGQIKNLVDAFYLKLRIRAHVTLPFKTYKLADSASHVPV